MLYVKSNLEVAGEDTTTTPSPKSTNSAGDRDPNVNMSHIRQADTFDSSTTVGDGGVSVSRKQKPIGLSAITTCWEDLLPQILYISVFAVLGTSLRIFMGRLFGLDCIWKEDGMEVGDFFQRAGLCITSDGKSSRGGAVFIDLPANMLGSYVKNIAHGTSAMLN